jgi:ABC-2 type transport system ATP-binding protein
VSTLSFRGVTRRFGDVVALNRLDLEVEPGILALVGPNGAGKSTFMKLATAHVRPTAGFVRAFDEPVWDNPAVMRRTGFVPEQDAFYEWMTGVDFVATLAAIHGIAGNPRRAAEAELERLGLKDGWDRPIKTYSKGMRQRVKLAQALIHEPELVLLDEPLLGCDPIARRRIQDRVRAMAENGATVVISSHILPEVERLTRDVAVIAGGRLVAHGDSASVRDELGQVPSRIRIHSGAPRVAAAALSRWDAVAGIRIEGGAVEVETTRMKDFLARLQKEAPETWKITGVDTMDADLDSLFSYLAEASA